MGSLTNAVIIVSGGSGTRMGSLIPKQYLEVNGKPVLAWTLEKFLLFDPGIMIILVIGNKHQSYWDNIRRSYFNNIHVTVTRGGEKRFHSVKNGLKMIDRECVVGIHDAARPMVSIDTIRRCYFSAREYGSAIPVIDVEDTIRSERSGISTQLDRETLKRVQTPQVFIASKIKEAYQQPYNQSFTDDASVFESMFKSVKLVEGNPDNIKITKQTDLVLASAILHS